MTPAGFCARHRHRIPRVFQLLLLAYTSLVPIFWILQQDRTCLRCELSVMMPAFSELSSHIRSPFSYKYRLFRYFDIGKTGQRDGCRPLLFVPGSAGSYRQVRSLGSAIFQEMAQGTHCMDIYTVDFHGELVPLAPHRLEQQATYVNDVCNWLVQKYSGSAGLVLVGHSFGGIVLRLLPAMPNYQLQNTVVAAITISSPHWQPPLRASRAMDRLYKALETLPTTHKGLSITSGDTDILVSPMLSRPRGPTTYYRLQRVESIPGNWADPHHQAMVWEKGTLRYLAKAIQAYQTSGSFVWASSTGGNVGTAAEFPQECDMGAAPLATSSGRLLYGHLCPTADRSYCHEVVGAGRNGRVELRFDASLNLTLVMSPGKGPLPATSSPGHVFHLRTNTDATTQITQQLISLAPINRLRGIVVHCNTTRLHKMATTEWNDLIKDGSVIRQYLLEDTFLQWRPPSSQGTIGLGPGWSLLLGHRMPLFRNIVRISLPKTRHPRYFVVKALEATEIAYIRIASEDGAQRYGHLKSGKQGYFVTDPETTSVQMLFEYDMDQRPRQVEIRLDLVETLLRRVRHNYDELFLVLFLGLLQHALGTRAGGASGALMFVALNFLRRLAAHSIEWWGASLLIDGLYSLWGFAVGLFLVRITSAVPSLGRFGPKMLLGLVAVLPRLLAWTLEWRNLLVLGQEIGLGPMLTHEARLPDLDALSIAVLTVFLFTSLAPSSTGYDKLIVASALVGEVEAPYQLTQVLLVYLL